MQNDYSVQYTNDGVGNESKVGVWIDNERIKVSFPKNMGHEKKDVRLLIKTLEKYMTSKQEQISVVRTNLNSSIGTLAGKLPIGTLFEIMEDYLENGYYLSQTVHFSDKFGRKIDFNKTIKKVTPNFYQDTFIYPRHILRTRRSNEEELLRIIHKFVVYKASRILEFYYGQLPVEEVDQLHGTREYIIDYLKQELFNSTNDYKNRLITFLLSFFEGVNGDNEINLFIETSNFELVWEEMLRAIFSNAKRDNFFFKTRWYLYNDADPYRIRNNKDSELDLIKLSTDNKNNKLDIFVIDAKYYSYSQENKSGTLPQTTDINKQLGYLYFVRSKINQAYPNYDKSFYNMFIVPFKKGNDNKVLKTFGYATSEMDPSEKVIGINADIKKIMEQYTRPNMMVALNEELEKEVKRGV